MPDHSERPEHSERPDHCELLVIGAGPYAYAAAAYARHRGLATRTVGLPMAFWRDQMPTDMYLRSGPDWHLDACGEDTFAGYLEDRGLRPGDVDPVPISVFLDHTDWFAQRKNLDVDRRLVQTLTTDGTSFAATMQDGSTLSADRVLAAPGIRHFLSLPDWYDRVPATRRSHTSELVSFDRLAGARVVIIGGRQSAYEWAALLCDHGAERVDVVHRHPTPTFAKVSWAFVDPFIEQAVTHRGWWRRLAPDQQTRITREFWQVGRLTLEHWLAPRLLPGVVTSHPDRFVVAVDGRTTGEPSDGSDAVQLTLSDGSSLTADHVVFASGYRADLNRVPYLSGVIDKISVTDGFPDLTEGFQTSLPGLWITGFASIRDFGPFYGFTRGCPSAARIAVDEMLGRFADQHAATP